MDFLKFPRTPHLFILPGLDIRDDKVLDEMNANLFFNHPIVLEEKVDGANIGISLSKIGLLLLQNRGNYITPGGHPQFDPIWEWAYSRIHLFQQYISNNYIVFGEWCYARHSIFYDALPDWFLGFDIFDLTKQTFMDTHSRNQMFEKLNIISAPLIDIGKFTKTDIEKLISTKTSNLYHGPIEGIYLRLEDNEKLIQRAKIVNVNFIQEIGIHWNSKKLTLNQKM
jgi:ATP-dependent RNA circularization protein (DNA/RNA ligase family)